MLGPSVFAKSFWFLVAALALVSAGCGGGDSSDADPTQTPGGTQKKALARDLLLESADFTDDWTYTTVSSDSRPFADCETADEATVTSTAGTGDFSPDLLSAVSETVFVFQDNASAAAGIAAMDERAGCVVQVLDAGGADNSEVTFSEPAQQTLETLPFGDGSAAFRVVAKAKAVNPNAFIQESEIYIDYLYATIDNVGILVLVSSPYEPFDTGDLEDVTALAVNKAAGELGVTVADPRGQRTPGASATPRPASSGGAGAETVALGETGTLLDRMSVRIVDVNFDAESLVLAENQFNDPAEPGKVMVLVTIEVTNAGSEPLDAAFDPLYTMIGDKGIEYPSYDPSCGVIPDEIEGVLAAGESVTGNVCMQPDGDDTGLALGVELFGDDIEKVYFSLQ